MFTGYRLIDFGDGRKLESLAGHLIDRPSPAARQARPSSPSEWRQVASRFDEHQNAWQHHRPWPQPLLLECGNFVMPVRPTPFGHIGLFPEQAENWRWLSRPASARTAPALALNLFGYTGAATLALVSAGFHVAHVDAAKPNVLALREAAALNGVPSAPIRYLVDDARKFTAREVRRNRRYHTIVLDPPAYGHAPRGQAWRIERDLWPLLQGCLRLLDPHEFRLLITGHSPHPNESEIRRFLTETEFFRQSASESGLLLQSGRSQLADRDGRRLDAGFYVRAAAPSSTFL